MKLSFIAAAGAALLCAAPFASVEARVGQAVEVQQEESFIEQASNYLFEAENSGIFVDEEKNNNKNKNKQGGDDGGEEPAPTPKKTKKPTPPKTKKPTKRPTTKKPTPPKTKKPTKRPTTKKPTKEPTTKKPTTKKPTREPTTRRPTREPTTPRPTRRTRRPTRRPTRNPTRRPTRQPTVSRNRAQSLLNREWTENECEVDEGERVRDLSLRCRDLDEGVCSLPDGRAIRRYGEKALEVCAFVGRPTRGQRLLNREWTENECEGERLRRLSQRCRNLNEDVCSLTEALATSRYGEKALEVCNFVGRPFAPPSEEYANIYYDLVEFDSISEDGDFEDTAEFSNDYEESETDAVYE